MDWSYTIKFIVASTLSYNLKL